MNTKLNKSDYILLTIYFVISITMQTLDYYDRDALIREYWIDFPVDIIMILLLISIFMYWLIPKYIIEQKKYFNFIFFSLLAMIVIGGIDKVVGYWSGDNDWSRFPSTFWFIIESISISANQMGLPFGLLLTKKYYESQTQLLTVEKQQKENELKLLRSQIDPHFLFNNLNTLDSLIDSDSKKAKEYINRLSLIYRYLIKTKDAEVMELSEEIELAENYMFLLKTRFGNDYDFKIEINSGIDNKFIPTGAIQALLENVVKHNKPQNNKAIATTILVEKNTLKVTNTKSGILSKDESFGTGLENLKARYKLLSDKEVIIINTGKEFVISIPIIKLIDEN